MRLSDAGLRRPQAKLIYADHRPSPWHTEDAAPRSFEPIVRSHGEPIEIPDCAQLIFLHRILTPSAGIQRQRKAALDLDVGTGGDSFVYNSKSHRSGPRFLDQATNLPEMPPSGRPRIPTIDS
jgi:hypothetical protein